MSALLKQLLAICRLRQGPQDLPYAPAVAWLLVLVALLAPALNVPHAQVLPRAALSALLLLGPPWLLLSLRERPERFVQTLIAMTGTGLLFTLAVAPLLFFIAAMPGTSPPPPQALWLTLMVLVLLMWKLTIDAHIWRQALDWPQAGGMLLALGMFFVEIGLDRWLQQALAV